MNTTGSTTIYVKYLMLLFLNCIFLHGCAVQKVKTFGEVDMPMHHYMYGMMCVERYELETAEQKFDRALELNNKFSPALAGKSLLLSIKAKKNKDAVLESATEEFILNFLSKAKKYANSVEEEYIAYTTGIRVYTNLMPTNWLEDAKADYIQAKSFRSLSKGSLPYYINKDAADYFMGATFYKAHKFNEAEKLFSTVLSKKQGKWHPKAADLYEMLQKAVRASSGHTLSDVAAKIAVKKTVNRADVAALLIDELKTEKLFAQRIPLHVKPSKKADYTPIDIVDNPFKEEILSIMNLNIRGMSAVYDNIHKAWLFKPESPVMRKEFAFMLEDLLIKITGNESMATAMLGNKNSPFRDVPPNVAWYNAVITVTARGLMKPKLSGEFLPDFPVGGAELLLAIFKLRDILN
jgi:hypothetical protein